MDNFLYVKQEEIRRILQDYFTYAGIEKPYQIIIDGTTILEGYTLEQLRLFFEDKNAVIYTTKCVKKELAILDKYAQLDEIGDLNEILDKLVCINECRYTLN